MVITGLIQNLLRLIALVNSLGGVLVVPLEILTCLQSDDFERRIQATQDLALISQKNAAARTNLVGLLWTGRDSYQKNEALKWCVNSVRTNGNDLISFINASGIANDHILLVATHSRTQEPAQRARLFTAIESGKYFDTNSIIFLYCVNALSFGELIAPREFVRRANQSREGTRLLVRSLVYGSGQSPLDDDYVAWLMTLAPWRDDVALFALIALMQNCSAEKRDTVAKTFTKAFQKGDASSEEDVFSLILELALARLRPEEQMKHLERFTNQMGSIDNHSREIAEILYFSGHLFVDKSVMDGLKQLMTSGNDSQRIGIVYLCSILVVSARDVFPMVFDVLLKKTGETETRAYLANMLWHFATKADIYGLNSLMEVETDKEVKSTLKLSIQKLQRDGFAHGLESGGHQ